ncbi:MAG: CPBP family intramembrane metalloprotease [Planctomycetota bacterium]|nr:CPBP family intramembrane metalloprotease [Planctomycetota bacterium]
MFEVGDPAGIVSVLETGVWALTGVLSLASLCLWVMIGRRHRAGQLTVRLNPQPRAIIRPLTIALSLGATVFSGVAINDLLKGKTGHPLEDVIIASVYQTFIIVALMALITREGDFDTLGITTESLPRQIKTGVTAFLASVLPVFLMMLAIQPERTKDNQHSFLKRIAEDPSFETIGWVVLTAVVLAPLFEELLFRVILQGALQRVLPPKHAILIVALLFSSIHGYPDALALFPLALILGYTYLITHRYWVVVTTHALFNAVNVALLYMALPTS